MIKKYEEKMQKTLDNLDREFNSIRAGRANPHVLDRLKVDYYGTPTPIQQVGNIQVPDARTIVIQPWETSMLKVIERYIDEQLMSEISYCRKVQDEPFPWNLDIGKAQAHQIDPAALFHIPEILRTDRVGQRFYDCAMPDPLKGDQIPYWYAFWETPHPSGYGPDEFRRELMRWKYMSGLRTGQTILKLAMNGGVLHAGVYTMNA